jgi:5-hydroxyisourate hydrolase
MARLSTHVLDTSSGRPAAGLRIELHRLDQDGPPRHLKTVTTNADGRTDEPLLVGEAVAAGTYRLTFHVGEYFANAGSPDACRFLREVPVVFGIDDPAGSYHVPLLVSPWSYSTYRGS